MQNDNNNHNSNSDSPRSKPPNMLYQYNILKKPDMDPKCRLCGRFDKTIDHLLVSGCPELAKTKYTHCHNKAAAHLHWKICIEFGIEVKEQWYEHEPKAVTKNDSITFQWDMPIHTDRTMAANRPDIVLKNKKDKTCLLIHMTIPLDTNTSVKTTEKLTKCKDLEIEVERMCGPKTTTVPVVMGALGTIKKDMENYSNKIPGNINTDSWTPESNSPFYSPPSQAGTLHQVETLFATITITLVYLIMIVILLLLLLLLIVVIITIIIYTFSIYTLSDFGDSGNLTASLSQTMMLYSPL